MLPFLSFPSAQALGYFQPLAGAKLKRCIAAFPEAKCPSEPLVNRYPKSELDVTFTSNSR